MGDKQQDTMQEATMKDTHVMFNTNMHVGCVARRRKRIEPMYESHATLKQL
jgi:hypothetical protein